MVIIHDVILHVDVDSFECQVHSRNRPDLIGKPFVVSNNGRIVSINQEAKFMGVNKVEIQQESDINERFPNVIILPVPEHTRWKKPDSKRARRASFQIRDEIINYQKDNPEIIVNYESTDEFFIDCSELVAKRVAEEFYPQYFDLSPNTVFEDTNILEGDELSVILYNCEFGIAKRSLVVGAVIANEIASRIEDGTGYIVSVGISSSMRMAKIASPLNKPNGFYILTSAGLNRRAYHINIRSVPGFKKNRGMKLCRIFGAKLTMGEAAELGYDVLQNFFGPEEAEEIYNALHRYEIDEGVVTQKEYTDSVSAGRSFPRPSMSQDQVPLKPIRIKKQLRHLGEEMMQRLKYEEFRFHKRKTSILKIEVTTNPLTPNNQSKYSHTFQIDEEYELGTNIILNGLNIANSALKGLIEVGFQSNAHQIINLRLVATNFEEVQIDVYKFLVDWLIRDTDARVRSFVHV